MSVRAGLPSALLPALQAGFFPKAFPDWRPTAAFTHTVGLQWSFLMADGLRPGVAVPLAPATGQAPIG